MPKSQFVWLWELKRRTNFRNMQAAYALQEKSAFVKFSESKAR